MHEAFLKLTCSKPLPIKKALEVEASNEKNCSVTIAAGRRHVAITIRTSKISYLKAIINSYISLFRMLNEVDEVV